MSQVFLALGSNLGDRQAHLAAATAAIRAWPEASAVQISPIYETPAMVRPGSAPQEAYLNAVVSLHTDRLLPDLLADCQAIELDEGRPPFAHREVWGPRTLDIDVLFYDDQVVDQPGLTVPHPSLAERWFVLKPMCDLAPDWVHPVLQRPMRDLLSEVEAKV